MHLIPSASQFLEKISIPADDPQPTLSEDDCKTRRLQVDSHAQLSSQIPGVNQEQYYSEAGGYEVWVPLVFLITFLDLSLDSLYQFISASFLKCSHALRH